MFNRSLHRYSLFVACCTFILIFIGGLVTSTGSGLSVPDWPTTYGQNMFTFPIDQWIGGIKYEHGHRLFASFVGFLTIILSVWIAVKEERKWMKWLGFAALGTVIVQGVLGGLTVLFLLPTPISVAHGMLAQTFLCIVSSIALFTSQWWKTVETVPLNKHGRKIQILTIISSIVVFIQLGFGAWMRHASAGLAVPDFPLAYGQLIPSLNHDSILKYNQQLASKGIRLYGDAPVLAYQIFIHMLHRTWAYVVALTILFTGYRIFKSGDLPRRIKSNGMILMATVFLQFCLGITTVLTRKEVVITTIHVAVGAFLLVLCIITMLMIGKMYGFRLSKNEFSK